MKIKNLERIRKAPSPRGFTTIARFTFEPAEGVAIYDCVLVRAPDGRHLIYGPPMRNTMDSLSLAPDVRATLIEMMVRMIDADGEYLHAA